MTTDFFKPSRVGNIRLTNDGALQVYFVGVGAAFSGDNFQSNMIVVKGEHHFMIDLGTKASLALRAAGLSVLEIENILVTHSHADHIGGLEEWCLRARYEACELKGLSYGEYKPNLLTTADYAPVLWDASLRGGMEYSDENRLGRRLTLPDYVNLKYGEPEEGSSRPVYNLEVGDISLKMMRTNHLPNSSGEWKDAFYSVGVLIDGRVLITGDTLFDKELLEEFGENAEVIFQDCQDFEGGVHVSYEELRKLPEKIKQKMYLYHLPDDIGVKYKPEDDGFLGWALPFNAGSYVFPHS